MLRAIQLVEMMIERKKVLVYDVPKLKGYLESDIACLELVLSELKQIEMFDKSQELFEEKS